jgi:dTDP-glucose 4,6-dehydratase
MGPEPLERILEVALRHRRGIDVDAAVVRSYVRGRCVLVTGAGGSIGSELSRRLLEFEPEQIVLLDHDDSALHSVALSVERGSTGVAAVLCDVRDATEVNKVFRAHTPEVVFHAAALKQLPLLETHPLEAVKTNVFGTLNVLEAALASDVGRVVNISTDKAADPSSVLGFTKRVAERLTAAAGLQRDRPYVSVRFGNVFASRGSVLDVFRMQLEAGGPITVTDPEATRYFMSFDDTCALLVQAGALGEPGEALVLDMGEPVRILDLAQALVDAAPSEIEIVFIGLRPGERLHEAPLGAGESAERRTHPLLSHVAVPPLPLDVPRLALHEEDLLPAIVAWCDAGDGRSDVGVARSLA